MGFPPQLADKVAQARMRIGETEVLFSDSPGMPIKPGNQLTICITTENRTTNRLFDALSRGGSVVAPLENTLFNPAFGTVKDKFGNTITLVAKPG